MLLKGGVEAFVVVGHFCDDDLKCTGHAWVEGRDERGWFMIEATSGGLFRRCRPIDYVPQLYLAPGQCFGARWN